MWESLVRPVEWREIFVPAQPILEMVLRGTLMYLFLFAVMRFLLKRQSGVIGIADLLVVVLIADAAQNALGAEYRSVTEGAVLVLTIVFWNYLIDWVGYRFPSLARFTRPAPLMLVDQGRMLRRNMASEMITREELMSQLRQQGLEALDEVKACYIEGDGRISVIRYEKEAQSRQESRPEIGA
jgi:uncharacterized membrane protein YcaP (DUF421 family)